MLSSFIPLALCFASDPSAPSETKTLDPTNAFDPTSPFVVPPLSAPLLWNHGPGTTGGGSVTIPGETLRKGAWAFELRSEWTEFEDVSIAEATEEALEHGHFDALGRSWINQLTVSYGLTDDLELGLQLGYYDGEDFIDAHLHGGLPAVDTGDPSGLMDTWLTAKWRVVRGASGHLALIGGVKFPTGDDEETLDGGHELEPSSAPGSGSVDYQAGLAYSRFLSPRVTLDTSGVYTLRTEHDDFEVGDRADLGVALNYRLTEDVKAPNNWSVFSELNGVWLDEDEEDGVANEDSGGETLYLALGVRDRISEHFAVSLAPALPVLQDLNGEQVETDWRVALALTFTP